MHKIGIISDTHGMLRQEVIKKLQGCEWILHCGDMDNPEILEQLKKIAPVFAVRGNVDKAWANLLPEVRTVTLAGIPIFMIHDKKQIKENCSDKKIILYGHSHKYEERWIGTQLWLNPGSCGARRFFLPITMAILTIQEDGCFGVERIELEERKQEKKIDSSAVLKNGKSIVAGIMVDVNQGKTVEQIAKKYQISQETAQQICRLYLTHPGVDVEGILNRIELGLR